MKQQSTLILQLLLYTLYFVGLAVLSGIVMRGIIPVLLWGVGGAVGIVLPRAMDIGLLLFGKEQTGNAKQIVSDFKQEFLKKQDTATVVPKSPLRSYPFLFGYAIASLYVLTSTKPVFGKALLLGVGLSLITDLLLHRKPKGELRSRWFRLFPTNLTDQELDIFVIVCVIGFGLISLLGIQA